MPINDFGPTNTIDTDERGIGVRMPTRGGLFYAPGGGYSMPSPGTRSPSTAQPKAAPYEAPPPPNLINRLMGRLGWQRADTAGAGSMLAQPQAELNTGITNVARTGYQLAPLGRNLLPFRTSAWQDAGAVNKYQSASPLADKLEEGPAPFRIQRPWMPGNLAWAGLRSHGVTQADFRLELSPNRQTAGRTRRLSVQRRSFAYLDATNTNAARRRIPSVRVPLTPLSGG